MQRDCELCGLQYVECGGASARCVVMIEIMLWQVASEVFDREEGTVTDF